MNRLVAAWLDAWLKDPGRRPLILRGARQVGKTWLVRDLASRSGREIVEVNFERDPSLAKYFRTNDPSQTLAALSLALDREIDVHRTLLFLDEIQAAGEVLAKLRWFYEEMPALPVVAAGSLLDFTLATHEMSMPVGRVSFRHVEPMGFVEFPGGPRPGAPARCPAGVATGPRAPARRAREGHRMAPSLRDRGWDAGGGAGRRGRS